MQENIRTEILETADEIRLIEDLQRIVWPGSETDIVPLHMVLTLVHNGGLAIGAFDEDDLIGFVYGFTGTEEIGGDMVRKHCSHQMGVHPDYRDKGIGYRLKRAQWQMVRHQEFELITWTYDPLLSKNGYLNIHKLGSVCRKYIPNLYGELRDGLNAGLPTDRFQVELWVNSNRVQHRMSRNPRKKLDLAHYLSAGVEIINPSSLTETKTVQPAYHFGIPEEFLDGDKTPLLLVEIPVEYLALKSDDFDTAFRWRMHIRSIFLNLFQEGFIVTDMVHLPGKNPRSFYVVSYGESTL
jgi:predicted GNAT superfamily acetyltransferase